MKIQNIVKGIECTIRGNQEQEIQSITNNSKDIENNSLFVCIRGFKFDGHNYIDEAIEKGAKAFVVDNDEYREGYTFIKVEDTRKELAKLSANFYNSPSDTLNVVGVTGTNGKTSITTFLQQMFTQSNSKSGSIGTISINNGKEVIEAKRTTPESLELQKFFREMLENDCKNCFMEVSSHSLELNRVDEVEFKIGIFTNLTPEHLDFHKDLDNYRMAKEKLFYKTSVANIINIDDEHGQIIYDNLSENKAKAKTYSYAIDKEADFMAKDIVLSSKGVKYTLVTPTYETKVFVPVPGRFTIYNTLSVIATAYLLGLSKEEILNYIENTRGVRGRFENIDNDKNINVIVDYAHTPDALENILNTAKDFTKGNIITVFGCGGDRDNSKRSLMGEIAQRLSDVAIVTSDNPRTEDPKKILSDVLRGIDQTKYDYHVIEDREQAIKYAILTAKENDTIIIAGKGHETYQIIGEETIHFDDKEIAQKYLTK